MTTNRIIKVIGNQITQAGILVEINHETRTRETGKIVGVYFPVHDTARFGKYQVCKDRQKYLIEHLIGQTRSFWKTGSRAGYEVGGDYWVEGEIR